MDKQTLLEICQPFKKIEVEGQVFYLRRLSPKHFNELHEKYFSSGEEEKTVIDTNMTADEVKQLSEKLQAKFNLLAEWELDILTYSLCNENGEPLFTIDERETVRIFDPVFYRPLKNAAYEFSYGYYHKQSEIQRKAEAKKRDRRRPVALVYPSLGALPRPNQTRVNQLCHRCRVHRASCIFLR